jgi:fumarate hydratase class II
VIGIEANREQIDEHLERSLMLVTALSPEIGYDAAAAIAKKALEDGLTLRQAAVQLGKLSEEEFDALVQPDQMARPHQDR